MRLKIVRIADRGVANQERLHFSVLVDANAAFYVVFSTVYAGLGGAVFAAARDAFWFPSRPLKAGDNVVLYTGPGTPTSNVRADGGTDHFFYWGSQRTLFDNPISCAVLAELNGWETGR